MIVNRRELIKQFLIVSVGVTFLPSCHGENKPSILLKNVDINGGDEKLLAEVSETIIPATDTPGAKELSAHLFALKMLDDCSPKEDQQKFEKGLKEFEKIPRKKFGKSFIDCTPQEREAIISELENGKKDKDNDVAFFYYTQKGLTVQGYTTSKFFLTQVHEYKLVPGAYKGCVPVAS